MSADDFDSRPQPPVEPDLPNLLYEPETESFRYSGEDDRWSMSEAVVSSVSVATERDPLDLPPLYSAIDPDALDALLSPVGHQIPSRSITVSFEYAGCWIVIQDQSRIRVRPSSETTGL
ncbi:HalOD1 output domain-containing protein [Haloarchaeobius baliensis]|uniref:HalOD1 output domain-containing protein n=1 Tax=Haloarchaeobius baliensis TaxID=1670458 RepID=UPI003F882DCE